jgi:probable rRNA maturation factor
MSNIILIRHPKNWGLSEELVLKKAKEALRQAQGYNNNIELSVIFVGRKKAKELNIKYRNKDYIPQVLGFPMDREKSEDGRVHLGDIVICTQKLKYEVKFQKSSLEKVLMEWMNHGVENLLKG